MSKMNVKKGGLTRTTSNPAIVWDHVVQDSTITSLFPSFPSWVSGMLPEIEVLEGAGKGVKGNGVIGIIDV